MKYHASIATLCLISGIGSLHAHGTHSEIISDGLIGVRAFFQDGTPIAHAEATIFPPAAQTPSHKTVTDSNGVVCFRPDNPGTWTVRISNNKGHGVRIKVDVKDHQIAQGVDTDRHGGRPTYIQMVITGLAVIWGFVGTALYFRQRKS